MAKHILDRLRRAGRDSRLGRFLGIERRSGDASDQRAYRELRQREEAASGGEQRMRPYLAEERKVDA